mmetsp:Transcript_32784/g.85102  ORF Transcript_32784/g.85102 Transcript_32784/m.85102 type:complete len:249 (-) Transcript_32784:159-905(-)
MTRVLKVHYAGDLRRTRVQEVTVEGVLAAVAAVLPGVGPLRVWVATGGGKELLSEAALARGAGEGPVRVLVDVARSWESYPSPYGVLMNGISGTLDLHEMALLAVVFADPIAVLVRSTGSELAEQCQDWPPGLAPVQQALADFPEFAQPLPPADAWAVFATLPEGRRQQVADAAALRMEQAEAGDKAGGRRDTGASGPGARVPATRGAAAAQGRRGVVAATCWELLGWLHDGKCVAQGPLMRVAVPPS